METLIIVLAVIGIAAIVFGIVFLIAWIGTRSLFRTWNDGLAEMLLFGIILFILSLVLFFQKY